MPPHSPVAPAQGNDGTIRAHDRVGVSPTFEGAHRLAPGRALELPTRPLVEKDDERAVVVVLRGTESSNCSTTDEGMQRCCMRTRACRLDPRATDASFM